jgi:Asp-tRNA(Asn)/Glu-tRNA(Gln) amidotransferase C subunit
MKAHEPISHWGNFTVDALKEILEHVSALEHLGIAQDEEMVASIERDISLREQKTKPTRRIASAAPTEKNKHRTEREPILLQQTA